MKIAIGIRVLFSRGPHSISDASENASCAGNISFLIRLF